MQLLFSYIIKVVLISAILYGYYLVALRNKKFHQYNRFYLLMAAILPILLPLVSLAFLFKDNSNVPVFISRDMVSDTIAIQMESASFWTWDNVFLSIYLAAVMILIFLFIASVLRIYRIKRKGIVQTEKEFILIQSQTNGTPFSFFRFIFWNPKMDLHSREGRQMFEHELAHVRQLHSLDKLTVNIIQIIFWFNPVFWMIKREINIVHEFLADKASFEDGDAHTFSRVAMQAAYPGFTWPATNSFFHSPLKRRLIMLVKNNQQKVSYFGRLMVLPLAACIFLIFSTRSQAEPSGNATPDIHAIDTIPGNPDIQSLKINGSTQTVTIIRNDGTKDTMSIEEAKQKGIQLPPPPPPPPSRQPPPPPPPPSLSNPETFPDNALYFLNGKKVQRQELNSISPDEIESISVLKGKAAIKKYGAKGKNGVVEIQTKSNGEHSTVQIEGTDSKGNKIYGTATLVSADTSPVVKEIKPNRIFTKTEEPASFPGGPVAWSKYIQKQIMPSLDKLTDKDYGTCTVKFIVDEDGTVRNVEAITMKGTELAKIAVDAIRNGPKWIPAKQNGIIVTAYRLQPVTLVQPKK